MIHNDFRALDALSSKLKSSIDDIMRTRKQMAEAVSILHAEGFADIKFQELKAKMEDSEGTIDSLASVAERLIASLQVRSKLIKDYYSSQS